MIVSLSEFVCCFVVRLCQMAQFLATRLATTTTRHRTATQRWTNRIYRINHTISSAHRPIHSATIKMSSTQTTTAAPTPPVGTPPAVKPIYNPGLPRYATPRDMLTHMLSLTRDHDLIRNYVGVIEDMSMANLAIETELFPYDSLEFYSRYNLLLLDLDNNSNDKALHAKYYTPARGGGQGDYRIGIREKISNVIDAIDKFPNTKRAVITIPHTDHGSITADHTVTDEAKCLRELHFYLDGPATGRRKLGCTGIMRAQAASIFPKNIHFIGTMMQHIANELKVEVGTYTHHVTTLVNER